MATTPDANEAIWRSGEMVRDWVADAGRREERAAPQWRRMADLLPFAPDEPFTFVDLGAGTGSAARAILSRYPKSSAVLADFSDSMMAEATRLMAPMAGRYRYVELDLRSGTWPAELSGPFGAVVSSLCIHHLPDERKASLFGEILERLVPGGWFVNYDPVKAPDGVAAEAWERVEDRRDPEAHDRRANRTSEEQERFENHIRHIAPIGVQLGYLSQAGFEGVDAYWKSTEYVVYGGRRPR